MPKQELHRWHIWIVWRRIIIKKNEDFQLLIDVFLYDILSFILFNYLFVANYQHWSLHASFLYSVQCSSLNFILLYIGGYIFAFKLSEVGLWSTSPTPFFSSFLVLKRRQKNLYKNLFFSTYRILQKTRYLWCCRVWC